MLTRNFNKSAVNERAALRFDAFRFKHFEELIEKGFVEVSVLHLFCTVFINLPKIVFASGMV
jgi:hypothetical protein